MVVVRSLVTFIEQAFVAGMPMMSVVGMGSICTRVRVQDARLHPLGTNGYE